MRCLRLDGFEGMEIVCGIAMSWIRLADGWAKSLTRVVADWRIVDVCRRVKRVGEV